MEFKKFLKEYVNFPLIDMIIIDAEFSEYFMLPILAGTVEPRFSAPQGPGAVNLNFLSIGTVEALCRGFY